MSCRDLLISMREQPAQLPDTNLLDLGILCALQTARWKISSKMSYKHGMTTLSIY